MIKGVRTEDEGSTELSGARASLRAGSRTSSAEGSPEKPPSGVCPYCGATLQQTVRFCSQCGHGWDALSAEAGGRGEKAAPVLVGLTSPQLLKLLQSDSPKPGETLRSERPVPLPEWLEIPLLPDAQATLRRSTDSAIPSRPPVPTCELPPLPSGLSPISIPSARLTPRSAPIPDARRISRLQELAGRGPWGGATPDVGAQESGGSYLPRDMPSILVAECGAGTTTAALIEAVEGRPRLAGSGRASTDGDLIGALQRACEVITGSTGRRLLGEKGSLLFPQQPTGQGVDRFVAVVDLAPPFLGPFTSAEDHDRQESLSRMPEAGQLRAWSDVPLRSVPSCLATVIRYLGETYQANVVGLDLGMARSWLVVWYEGQLAVVAGGGPEVATESHVHSEARGPIEALTISLWHQWMAQSKSIPPHQPPALDLVVLRGSVLASGVAPLDIVRLMADVLQPRGTCTLLWDGDGLAAALGALAVDDPAMATCLLDGDAFLRLGTLIAPWGHPPSKGIALHFSLAEPGGGRQQGDVATGCLRQIPLPLGRSAILTLHPASGLDLGAGQPGGRVEAEVPGALAGLLLDGRGRPLPALD